MNSSANETPKPIHKIRVGNGITASIWANQTEDGILHTVEVERRYKQGDDWNTSKSFVGAQVLLAAKAYELSFDYITHLKAQSIA